MDEKTYKELVEKAKAEGYDVSKLQKTPQSDPPPESETAPDDTKGIWWIKSILGKQYEASIIHQSLNIQNKGQSTYALLLPLDVGSFFVPFSDKNVIVFRIVLLNTKRVLVYEKVVFIWSNCCLEAT